MNKYTSARQHDTGLIGRHHATVSRRAEYGGLKRILIHSPDGAAATFVADARQRDAQTFIVNASSEHAPSTRRWSFSRLLHPFAYDSACAGSRSPVGHRRQRPPLLQTAHPGDPRSFQPLFRWETVVASVSKLFSRLVILCTAPPPACAAVLSSCTEPFLPRSSYHAAFSTDGHTRTSLRNTAQHEVVQKRGHCETSRVEYPAAR